MRKLFLGVTGIVGVCALMLLSHARYETPVLMYHHVDYDPDRSSIYVAPSIFESQMEFLKVHGYRVVPLAQIIEALRQNKVLPQKTVAITFDDGTLDNFKNAFPVLRKMGFPATIFMITDNIGKDDWLSEEDLKILAESDISIGSHTGHHVFLPQAKDWEGVVAELKDSKDRLEKILQKPVTLFSYPAGGYTPKIAEAVRQAGYEGAVTTNYLAPRFDPYAVRRIKITEGGGSLFNFWMKLSGFYSIGRKKVKAVGYDDSET